MVTSDGTTREITGLKLPLVIGRSSECKLRVPVDSVSRQHCELSVNDDEELVIRDLKSSNGTFVNRERVATARELVPGDLLSIGPVVFVVRLEGHPRQIDAATAFAQGAVAVGGGAAAMIDGVPTWTGQAVSGAAAGASPRPASPPSGSAKAKPSGEEDDFESLLKSLREDDDK
ncbi:MAG: FHA domain-containing protein [Phycisphaerales bacterium]